MTDAPEMSAEGDLRAAAVTGSGSLLSLIFLTAVAFCLVFPLLQTVHRFVHWGQPLEERRAPAPFPALGLLSGANGDFARQLNAWFDDRVGFRDLFIRTKNQIDYSLFRTSRKVFVGKHGWLFERSGYEEFEQLSPAELAAVERRFTLLAERLAQRGIRLIVIGYPDKAMVYTDMATAEMPAMPTDGNFDKLRHFLAGQPSLSFIDATALLRRERSLTSDHLFAMTDFHPTEVGHMPVLNAVVAEIDRLEGRPAASLPKRQFRHETYATDWGTEARLLSLLKPVAEPAYPVVVDPDRIGADEPDGKWVIPDRVALQRADDGIGRPFDWEFRSNPELCQQRLPGTVLFGNSFSDLYWDLGLQHHFCFLRRARDPMSRFKLFYQTMPPDTKYMIYEFVEFWLPRTAPPDDYAE